MGRSKRRRIKHRHYGTVEILTREKKYAAPDLLDQLPQDQKHYVLDGRRIEVNNLRIRCFREKGMSCSACGLRACFFALEYVRSTSYDGWTINLYGHREDGAEVIFTKDHIQPLSLEGSDGMENLQTMCWPCNQRKGSKVPATTDLERCDP